MALSFLWLCCFGMGLKSSGIATGRVRLVVGLVEGEVGGPGKVRGIVLVKHFVGV